MSLRRVLARTSWRRRVAALLVAAACGAACLRAPATHSARATFPRANAAALAHLLADFSTHPQAGSWFVEEERGNYTEWHYRVSFECGPRCAGTANVHAAATPRGDRGALSHGRARSHRVRVALTACSRLPLLPWPQLCDEMEIDSLVYDIAEGCVLEERARAWCGVGRVLLGACARELREHRDVHLVQVHAALLHQSS